jgi:hypothetical protein
VAFITNVCPHYRRPLYELLAQRLDVDFYFFSEGRERYISDTLPLEHGAFRTCPLRRVSVLGEPFTPGIASRLLSCSYDVVAFAAAIRRLLQDERYASALGAQARLHVERFNFEAMADGFEAAIEHAMASR